jgi:hypothetical protein
VKKKAGCMVRIEMVRRGLTGGVAYPRDCAVLKYSRRAAWLT